MPRGKYIASRWCAEDNASSCTLFRENYISKGVGINLFSLLSRGFSGPKSTDLQRLRYPRFLFVAQSTYKGRAILGVCWRKHNGLIMRKFKKKTNVLIVLMAVLLLPPFNLFAQESQGKQGGLFRGNEIKNSGGMLGRNEGFMGGNITGQGFGATNGNLTGQGFGVTNGNITGQTFGAPLGNGLFILLTAGIGYSALKSKKTSKQNRKEK